jgi:ubiquinone/menaquinone biosynthesis methyltransferases
LTRYHGVSKEQYVHTVFSSIADKYDWLNTILSFNQDKHWRTFAIEKAGLLPDDVVLDVASGTGMMALEAARVMGTGRVIGLDFCQSMLQKAKENISKAPYAAMVELVQGNALHLPFGSNTFKAVTIGFGLRNMANYQQVISEMARVANPGGRVVSLELAKPRLPGFKQLYYFYFKSILPLLGRIGIGFDGPYRWLPESLALYPGPNEICEYFTLAGLKEVKFYELTGGIVAVHVGIK